MANKKYQKNKAEPINKDAWPRKELFLFEPRTLFAIIITAVLTLLVAFLGEKGIRLFTSVISPIPEHAPFNGTTYPIKQVPNWVKLTEAERKLPFSSLPPEKLTGISSYNPSHLAIPLSSLKWNDSTDDAIRNEKITYSVPYLGNYQLDGVENAGSHPGIDMKVPEGTPIYAIANGTVIKAEVSSGGFGNHVVIQHNNFPTPDNQNSTTTLYSSYSHLSSISVKVNDVVVKGQLIGASGMTGTATTPHLHFQIDKDSAPWHPYWPFSSKEMKSAGYSFFQAINNGLGQSNAIANTVNPLRYVQKYFGDQTLVASSLPTPPIAAEDEYEKISFLLQRVAEGSITVGSSVDFIIQAFDPKGSLLSKPTFKDEITLSLLNGNGTLNVQKLTAESLRTGIASGVSLSVTTSGKEKLLLRFRDREFSSQEFEIEEKKPKVNSFVITPERTDLTIGDTSAIFVRARDDSGNPVKDIVFEQKPLLILGSPIGSLSVTTLSAENFASGDARITLTAERAGSALLNVVFDGKAFESPLITVKEKIVEAVPVATEIKVSKPSEQPVVMPQESGSTTEAVPPKIAGTSTTSLENSEGTSTNVVPETGTSTQALELHFSDIPLESKYYEATKELKELGIFSGYPDGSFQPDRDVSRAEAATVILRFINATIKEEVASTFSDVKSDAWYAKFVGAAYELGFVKGYPDSTFGPANTVNLAEFLTMVFTAAKMDIDPEITTPLPSGFASTDWFAPYIQEALRKSIIEVKDNELIPGKPMSRGEIAQILWKMKQLEKDMLKL